MKKVHLEISGMTCDHCARTVERALRRVEGAATVRASYAEARAEADVAASVSDHALVKAVEEAGYNALVTHAPLDQRSGMRDRHDRKDRFDLLVIGTGAAGMAAAIRGAELGRRVAIVEHGTIGGTCVNVGCIPSKNLLAVADAYHSAQKGFPGVGGCTPSLSWPQIRELKEELVATLRQSKYEDVLDSYPEITLLRGRARFTGSGAVEVDGVAQQAKKVVIATGTSPWIPSIPGLDSVDVLTSTTVMELDELPSSMTVLGGSAVGLELGQVLARLGVRVTVLEVLPGLLTGEDEDAAAELRRRLESEGLEIFTDAQVTMVEAMGDQVVLHATVSGQKRTFEADRVLAATGRRANTDSLQLEQAGVELDPKGFVRVNGGMQTSNTDVFAAGDVTGGPGFVYVAAAGGRAAADNALGDGGRTLDLRVVPRVTFTSPQVAAVGLGPSEARANGLDVDVSRLGLEHVPRALVEHQGAGWIQVVAEKDSGRIVGVQAVGPNAAELLGEATLAVGLRLTIDQVTDTLHPYLTWVEGFKLAVQAFRMDVSKLSCCA
jgi:mercuric reductase